MKINKNKALVFCRVSSKEQEETGFSLPAQEKYLKEYCVKKNLNTAQVVAISESASSNKRRREFTNMMHSLKKQGITILVCEKVDRLTRNLKDAVLINEWLLGSEENQVHFVKEGVVINQNSMSHEKFIWNIKASVAQFYIDNLSEEVKKGQKEKLAQGWLPTKPPIGYKTVGQKGKKIHVPDETTASLVKKMFDLYASGNYSLKKLTEEVYSFGLTTDRGNKIAKSRIHFFLRNPFYIGTNVWKGKEYPGKQEPIIDRATFKQVQQVLTSKNTPKYRKHNYFLKSLVTCKECAGTVTWEKQKGIIYGHCNHYRDCTQSKWAREDNVTNELKTAFDNLVLKSERVAQWLIKALKESHKSEIDFHQSSVEELNNKMAILKHRVDRIYEDILDERVDEDHGRSLMKKYEDERLLLAEQVKQHINSDQKYLDGTVQLFQLSQRAPQIFEEAKTDDKRKLIRLVFNKLTLDEGKLEYTYTPAFETLKDSVFYTNGLSSKVPNFSKIEENIFEPSENIDDSVLKEGLETFRSKVLPR